MKLPAGSHLFSAKPADYLSVSVNKLPLCTRDGNLTHRLLVPGRAAQGCAQHRQTLPVLNTWPASTLNSLFGSLLSLAYTTELPFSYFGWFHQV